MKRIMTLVGAIIGVVFDAIFSLLMLIGIAALLELLDGVSGSALIGVIGILLTALGVVTLVFNAMAISVFSCDHEKYLNKRKFLITAIVMNFILALLSFIVMCVEFSAMYLLLFLASVAASVLIIVDMSLESKRVENLQPSEFPANNDSNL